MPAGIFVDLPSLCKDLHSVDLGATTAAIEKLVPLVATEEAACAEIAKICADKTLQHPEWGLLAGRVQMYALRRKVSPTFAAPVETHLALYDKGYREYVSANAEALEAILRPGRDKNFDMFGLSTLLKSYLLRQIADDQTEHLETPQHMYLRVATYLYYPDLAKIAEVYDKLSRGMYSHASPTMYNAGTRRPQLASCFA